MGIFQIVASVFVMLCVIFFVGLAVFIITKGILHKTFDVDFWCAVGYFVAMIVIVLATLEDYGILKI